MDRGFGSHPNFFPPIGDRMTKNILLTQTKRNDMGLSIKKLLDDYFRADEVQDALRDIDESTSGAKDELVQRLRSNWESHNRDVYELLDFIDKDSLEMICYYYNLDATPSKHDVLKRRIKKANLLGSGKRPTAHVNRSHDSLIPKNKSQSDTGVTDVHFYFSSITHSIWVKIGAVATIVGIIVTIIFSAGG